MTDTDSMNFVQLCLLPFSFVTMGVDCRLFKASKHNDQ